jgi:hypothetical protein
MTKPNPIVGAHADMNTDHYRFPRQQRNPERDWEEKCPPMESLAQIVVGWCIILCCVGVALRIAQFIYEALIAQGILGLVSP